MEGTVGVFKTLQLTKIEKQCFLGIADQACNDGNYPKRKIAGNSFYFTLINRGVLWMSSQLITTHTNVLCVSLLSWCNSGANIAANI